MFVYFPDRKRPLVGPETAGLPSSEDQLGRMDGKGIKSTGGIIPRNRTSGSYHRRGRLGHPDST